MTRYRAEVYDPDFNFISFGAVSNKDIRIDYLAEEVSTVTIPELIDAHTNDYIAVRQNGLIYVYGVISDVAYGKGTTTISFVHFMSKLNVEIIENPSIFDTVSAEEWLYNRLTGLYNSSDTYQNLHGFSCSYTTQTMIKYEREDEAELETINLFTFVQEILTKHDIILTWSVDFAAKSISCVIGKINTNDVWNMKLGLADTPEYSIDIHSIEGAYNKLKYINELNAANTVTYYLHSDGTIDTDGTTDRLTPVTYTEKTAQADTTQGATKTFEQVALEDAQATMLNTDFNHEIIVTFNASSKLLSVGNIGQLYNLITPEGVVYSSILTGFEQVNVQYLRMVFGYIRTNLTTILKMQRRKR